MQALSSLFNKITPALTSAMAPQQPTNQLPPGFQPVRPGGPSQPSLPPQPLFQPQLQPQPQSQPPLQLQPQPQPPLQPQMPSLTSFFAPAAATPTQTQTQTPTSIMRPAPPGPGPGPGHGHGHGPGPGHDFQVASPAGPRPSQSFTHRPPAPGLLAPSVPSSVGVTAVPAAGGAAPDMSHLSEQERRIIESVIQRQQQEEEREMRKSNSVGGVVKALFGAPSRAGGQTTMLCALCRRTQFVGDSGNTCLQCGVKTCMRCGSRVSNRNNDQILWLCANCKQRQPGNNGASYAARSGSRSPDLERTAAVLSETANRPALNPSFTMRRQMPTASSYEGAMSSAFRPSYAGAGSSAVAIANSATGSGSGCVMPQSGDSYVQRKTFQPAMIETSMSIAREVSTGSSTFVSSPDFDYNNERAARYAATIASARTSAANEHAERERQFTQNLIGTSSSLRRSRKLPSAPYGRSVSVAAMYNHVADSNKFLGSCSSEEEMYTTECTSCDEFGETESIMSEQNFRSRKFGPLRESALESVEYHRRTPCLVTWQRSADRARLIGHMILKKNIPAHDLVACGVTDSNGLGLKVVGGKLIEPGLVGAFVTMITPGSVADMVGRLRVGDQILEWNGQSLQGASLDEVYQIILDSKDNPQVEIIAQRSVSALQERHFADTLPRSNASLRASAHRNQHNRHRLCETRNQTLFETMSDDNAGSKRSNDPCPIHDVNRVGRVQIRMLLDEGNGYLIVTLLCAFASQVTVGNTFCSLRLIPEHGQVTTRRSKSILPSRDLRWNQTFVFPATSLNLADSVFLELSLCDEETNGAIAQTELQLCDALLGDEPTWYTLYRGHNEVMPKRPIQHRRRVDNTYPDDAGYSDEDRQTDVRRSHPASARQHSRSHSPNRRANAAEIESSEYESDAQRIELHQPNSRSNRRSPVSPRRFKNSPHQHAGASPRNYSISDSSKRSPPKEQDIYERYQQLIEQSKRDRHSQSHSHSSSARNRRHSHGTSARFQRENHVGSDASESGVSESPQPSVRSVERSKRPNTLAMRPLSDVSEDAQSKDDTARVSDAVARRGGHAQKHLTHGVQEDNGNEEAAPKQSSVRRNSRKSYARSVSAESPDVIDEAATTTIDPDTAATKDGNASDSGVATGSATSGNGNNAATDGNQKATATTATTTTAAAAAAAATSSEAQPDAKSGTQQNAVSTNQTGANAKDSTENTARRKQTDVTTPKKVVTKIGNRSSSSSNLQEKKGQFQRSEEVGRAAQLRAAGASKPDLTDTGGFIEGLGSGQIVGRQALGATCLGEIQLSLLDRKSALEVEVIRCRNLAVPKNVAKVLPACYVKLYLMDKKHCLEKQRTNVSQKRTLEPVYQQKITFTEVYKERTLQVMVWGDYARTDRKVFMGVAQINLGALDLRKCVLDWFKLYPANSIVGGVAE